MRRARISFSFVGPSLSVRSLSERDKEEEEEEKVAVGTFFSFFSFDAREKGVSKYPSVFAD